MLEGNEPVKRLYSKELIKRTKEVWEPRFERPLTDEEAKEIIYNARELLDVLVEMGVIQ